MNEQEDKKIKSKKLPTSELDELWIVEYCLKMAALSRQADVDVHEVRQAIRNLQINHKIEKKKTV